MMLLKLLNNFRVISDLKYGMCLMFKNIALQICYVTSSEIVDETFVFSCHRLNTNCIFRSRLKMTKPYFMNQLNLKQEHFLQILNVQQWTEWDYKHLGVSNTLPSPINIQQSTY